MSGLSIQVGPAPYAPVITPQAVHVLSLNIRSLDHSISTTSGIALWNDLRLYVA